MTGNSTRLKVRFELTWRQKIFLNFGGFLPRNLNPHLIKLILKSLTWLSLLDSYHLVKGLNCRCTNKFDVHFSFDMTTIAEVHPAHFLVHNDFSVNLAYLVGGQSLLTFK
jgi:hypothetical protein